MSHTDVPTGCSSNGFGKQPLARMLLRAQTAGGICCVQIVSSVCASVPLQGIKLLFFFFTKVV